jgi:hypothetical protein
MTTFGVDDLTVDEAIEGTIFTLFTTGDIGQGTIGPQGPQGKIGPQGPQGSQNEITVISKTNKTTEIIPVPKYTGELYIGLNAGVELNTWSQIIADIKTGPTGSGITFPQPLWVQDFKGLLLWGGQGYVWATDYKGQYVQYYYVLSGGNGTDANTTYCRCIDNLGSIFIGGNFTKVTDPNGITDCNRVFIIDPLTFSVKQYTDNNSINGFNDTVYSIRFSKVGNYFIFGGKFTANGDNSQTLERIAIGNPGQSWQIFTPNLGITDGIVYDAIDISLNGVDVDSIIIGGSFSNINGGNIIGYKFNSTYFFIGGNSGIFNNTVNVFEIDEKPYLYIGGNFTKNSSIPSDYCVYIPITNFTNITSYTFPCPVNSIYFNGNLWIGGNNNQNNGIVYLNGTKVDQINFTNGLTIGQKGSFTNIPDALVLANNNVGNNNGAYLYSIIDRSVNFTVDPNTSIVNNPNYTDVLLESLGDSFTLIGDTQQNAWYIQSFHTSSGNFPFSTSVTPIPPVPKI